MFLSQAPDDFYEMTPVQLWGETINPRFLSVKELDQAVKNGMKTWKVLHPPRSGWEKYKGLATFALIAVSAGAAAMVIGAGAVAGAAAASTGASAVATGAGSAAMTAGATTAAATAAAGSGGVLTAGSALGMVKTGAAYLSKGAAIYTKVTGKETPAELMAAADLVANSGDFVDAGQKAFDYYVAQTGQKVVDEKQRELIRERLKREQVIEADRLRKLAQQRATGQEPGGVVKFWPLLIPAGLAIGLML